MVHALGEIAAELDPADLEALLEELPKVYEVFDRLASRPGRLDVGTFVRFSPDIESFPDSAAAGDG